MGPPSAVGSLFEHRGVAHNSSIYGGCSAVGYFPEGWVGRGLLDLSQDVDYLEGPAHEVPGAHIVDGQDGE